MIMLNRRMMTCALFLGALAAKAVTWTTEIPAAAPMPQDLWLRSGTAQFDLMLGAGGAVSALRANAEANKPLLATSLSIVDRTIQWGLMAGTTIDDGDSATDDRFYVRQSGGFGERLSPIMQIVTNATTSLTDIYSVPQDQWAKHLRSAVQGKFSTLTRYEPLSDGSIKIRRVVHLGAATTNGAPFTLENPYFENLNTFHVATFNALATDLKSNGGLEVYYHQGSNIPQDPQTDVTQTTGYAVVYNRDDTVNRAVLGVVFGNQQPAGGHQHIVNYSDGTDNITVRPGLRISTVPAGSILDLTYYLVPGYGLNSALVTRLNTLVPATPAPVVYAPGYAFTGELATIVQNLTNNLSAVGLRSDRLGGDVVIPAIAARPMLLSGPEDADDIRARLAIFPQTPENVMQAYLYGSDADKIAANTYFFRYPGSIDGNGLLEDYTTGMSRYMMWAQYRYDIALALGKATQAQRDLMKRLTEEFMAVKCPVLPIAKRGAGNLSLETFIAMGLCGLNFPELPESQLWVSRSMEWVNQEMGTYFPDGVGTESPRYHEWVHEMISKYLYVMKRRGGIDLFDHPNVRASIEWVMRYTSPPLSIIDDRPVLPAWGDTTYSSWGQVLYYYDLPIFAVGYKDSDPAFAARLMHGWRKTGSIRSPTAGASGLTNIQILDPRMGDGPQKNNSSTYAPTIGHATLRTGDASPDELVVNFKCGANGVHGDSDAGTFDLFAFGVPLALDAAGGGYVSGVNWNRRVQAHNTVCFNGWGGDDWWPGTFNAFGSSDVADYVVAKTPWGSRNSTATGTLSNRHLVFVKPDYVVVWDEIEPYAYADWFFHVPGSATLEWQPHKVISHTPWDVDLDIHVLLPAGELPLPNVATNVLPNAFPAVTNCFASVAQDPLAPALYTTTGEGHFGEWITTYSTRNPFDFQWVKFLSIRNGPAKADDFVTVLHPRKVGVTAAITPTLVSASSAGVTLSVVCDGRTDTIIFTTTGVTVTKGGQSAVQFAKTYPQSGVSGAAGLVKADLLATTTLSTALTTTGPVTVDTGTLALGGNNRIPDSAPLTLSSCGIFDLNGYSDTVGALTMNGGLLTGAGTLTCSSITWWGGKVAGTLVSTGGFTKKDGVAWSPTHTVSYAGDTILEAGTLRFGVGGPDLSGTGKLILSSGTTLELNGTARSFVAGDLTAPAGSTITTGSGALTLTGTGTNMIGAAFSGNLVHAGSGPVTLAGTVASNSTLVLHSGAWLSVSTQTVASLTAQAGSTLSLSGNFTAGSTSTAAGAVAGTGMLVGSGTLSLASTTTLGPLIGLGTAGAGILDLSAGTTFTVPWLTIDGVLQPPGTWNAARDAVHFAGSGSLVVTNGLAAPSNLTLQTSGGSAILTWSGVVGAAGYRVKRATQPGGPYNQIATTTNLTWTDISAGNGTTYYYVVAAENSYGESESTDAVQIAVLHGTTASPAVISGTRLWLDATRDDTLTLASGAVSQWDDARGNGASLSQGTPASRPTYRAEALLTGPAAMVVDFGPFSATAGLWLQANAEIADIRSAFWVGKSTMENNLFGSTTTYYHFHTGASTLWHSYNSAAELRNGTTWLNGTAINGVTTPLPAAYTRVGLVTTGNLRANALGRDRTYRYGAMQVGETIILNTAPSDQQRQDIDAYLAYKWSGSGEGVGNLFATTALTLSGGGVLDISGENYQALDGIQSSDASGCKIRLGASRLTVGDATDSVFDGAITGRGGRLVKTGSGTLTLSGASSYTGGTTVEAGTLALAGATTSGAGDLTVAAGATCAVQTTADAITNTASVLLVGTGRMNLTAGVTETVRSLSIDGVLQAAGIWDAARDGVHFAGSGSLVVLEGLPETPTSPSATMVSSSRIDLSWTDAAVNETGCRIERSLSAETGFAVIALLPANSTGHADTELASSTTYYYRVCATNSLGASAYAPTVSAKTRLATPTGFSASEGNGQVTLNWNPVAEATGYTLKRASTPSSGHIVISDTAVAPFVDTGLVNNTPYYYLLSATNAEGASAETVEIVAVPSTVPANNGSWTSTVSGNWSDGNNWSGGLVASGADRTATFNQSATVTVTQDLVNRTIGRIVFNSGTTFLSGNTLTLSTSSGQVPLDVFSTAVITAPLVGAGDLVKSGPSTLILRNVNTFGGNLLFREGSLWFSTGLSLPATTTIEIGATSGTSAATLTWEYNGLSINNPIIVNAGSSGGKTIVANNGVTGYISSLTLNDNLNLIKSSGTGSLVVSGTTTFAGGTRTLNVIASWARLGGAVTDGGNGYGLTKTGVGTLILSGSGEYTGATTVSAGILQIGNNGASGTLAPTSTLNNNSALIINRTGTLTQGADFSSLITGTGTLTNTGSGTLILSELNTYTGVTAIKAGILSANSVGDTGGSSIGAGTNPLHFTGAGTFRFTGTSGTTKRPLAFIGAGTLDVPSGAALTLGTTTVTPTAADGAWTGGGGIVKTGAGTLTLRHNWTGGGNRFNVGTESGGTFLMTAGTLNISPANYFTLGDTTANRPGTFIQTGGNVVFSPTAGNVTGNDVYIGNGSTSTLTVSGGTFKVDGSNLQLRVGRGGTSTGTLTVGGGAQAATVTTPKVAIGDGSAGTVNLQTNGLLATTTVIKGPNAATFVFDGGTLQATAAAPALMTGLSSTLLRVGGAIIDTQEFDATIGQALLQEAASTNGGLTKLGTGTLTLSGASTYTGGTALSAGRLVVSGSGRLGIGPVSVAGGTVCELLGSADMIDDSASLRLDASAQIVLGEGVTETVAWLLIDDAIQGSGVWNAARAPDHFSGTGTLLVTGGMPPEPSGLAAASLAADAIGLIWTDNAANEDGYTIERLVGETFVELVTLGPDTTSYTDAAGLEANSTYTYRVRAFNSYGPSAYSAVAQALTRCLAPEDLVATPGYDRIDLTWSEAAGATQYRVRRASVSGGPYTVLATVDTLGYADTSASNGTTWFYGVAALNTGGESAYSEDVSARPLQTSGNGIWNNVGGGSWSNAANWLEFAVASGADYSATFGLATSGAVVTQDRDGLTLGRLIFATDGYTVQGSPLTLATISGTPSITVSNDVAATLTAPLAGSADLLKDGSGTLVIAAASTRTGTTTLGTAYGTGPAYISDGVLRLAHGDAAGSGTLVINGGYQAGRVELSGGIPLANAITLQGRQGPGYAGLSNLSGENTVSGPIHVVANGSRVTFESQSGTLTVTGTAMTGASGRALTFKGNGNGVFEKPATAAVVGTVSKYDAGSWTLSGANTYAGATSISVGTLVVQNSAALGTTAAGTTVSSGATLDLGGSLGAGALNLGVEVITISGTGVGGAGALVNNGSNDQINAVQKLVLADDATLGGVKRWDVRGAGNSLDMAGKTLTKTGANMVGLTGTAISNPGHIDVAQGSLGLHTAVNLGGTSANTMTVRAGATLDFYANAGAKPWTLILEDGAVTTSSGSSTWAGPCTLAGTNGGTFTINSGHTFALSGAVGESLEGQTLIKEGDGTLTLSGSNRYAGGTRVQKGTLMIAAAAALPVSGTVALSADATLDLAGGSPLAAPATVASLTCSGGRLRLATTDRLTISGDLTGNLRIAIADPQNLVAGQTYLLATYSGDPPDAVALDGLAYPWTVCAKAGEIRLAFENGTLFKFF